MRFKRRPSCDGVLSQGPSPCRPAHTDGQAPSASAQMERAEDRPTAAREAGRVQAGVCAATLPRTRAGGRAVVTLGLAATYMKGISLGPSPAVFTQPSAGAAPQPC